MPGSQVVRFRYVPFPIAPSPSSPTGRTAMRPVVLVTLENGIHRVNCYAILDSGADSCVFPTPFLSPLGLNPLLASSESSSGVGSYGVPTYFFDIVARIAGTAISFPLRAGFTPGLGRPRRIFNRFFVSFDLCRSGTFSIEVPTTE
jgi:hypothetical protein